MIEFALCFGPLAVLVFFSADIALYYFKRGALLNATREAARYAITYATTLDGVTCGTQTACVKEVIKRNSLGYINSTNADALVQVNYYAPGDLSAPLLAGELPKTVGGKLITNMNQTGNMIQVSIVDFDSNFLVPFTTIPGGEKPLHGYSSLKMNLSTVDVLQALPAGVFTYPSP